MARLTVSSNATVATEHHKVVLPTISTSPGYTAVIIIHIPTLVSVCMIATFLVYLVNHILHLRYRDQDPQLDLEQGGSPDDEEDVQEKMKREALEKLLPRACDGSDQDATLLSTGECVICLEDFKTGEPGRGFPGCNHVFHLSCIYQWLKNKITCPLCRQSLLNTREGRRLYHSLFS